jgi:hypothetical protein
VTTEDSTTTGSHSIRCPFCEVYELERSGEDSARCTSCKGSLDAQLLSTLREIRTLPEALGAHPCEECGHPQMRKLPDGTFHCSACGSEVLHAYATFAESGGSGGVSEAYLSGWMDGLFGSSESFVHNRELGQVGGRHRPSGLLPRPPRRPGSLSWQRGAWRGRCCVRGCHDAGRDLQVCAAAE